MKSFRLGMKLVDPAGPVCRWTVSAPQPEGEALFLAMGRMFELAQRETGVPLGAAVRAFMRGAMLEKGDVVEAMEGS